jgi:hypothetical protein
MAHHTDFKLPKTDPKFTIGQKVIFINDNGVNWGEKTITEHEWDDIRGNIYQYTGSDTPWYKTSERNLFDPSDQQKIAEVAHHRQVLAKTDLRY